MATARRKSDHKKFIGGFQKWCGPSICNLKRFLLIKKFIYLLDNLLEIRVRVSYGQWICSEQEFLILTDSSLPMVVLDELI